MKQADLLVIYANVRKDKPYHKEGVVHEKGKNYVETIDARYVSEGKVSIIISKKPVKPPQ